MMDTNLFLVSNIFKRRTSTKLFRMHTEVTWHRVGWKIGCQIQNYISHVVRVLNVILIRFDHRKCNK